MKTHPHLEGGLMRAGAANWSVFIVRGHAFGYRFCTFLQDYKNDSALGFYSRENITLILSARSLSRHDAGLSCKAVNPEPIRLPVLSVREGALF
jgi:hypothetical protein